MVNEKSFGFWLDFVQNWFLDPRLTEEQAIKPLRKYAEKGNSLRPFYEAFASLVELPMQSGEFDEEWGLTILPYLIHEYWEEEDWFYRLYECFEYTDPQLIWDRYADYQREKQSSSERFDYLEDTSSPREERIRRKFKGKRAPVKQVAA